MKTALLLIFLSAVVSLGAQTTEQKKVLENYFQLLPVCGPSADLISAIDNDKRFIADSVVNHHYKP